MDDAYESNKTIVNRLVCEWRYSRTEANKIIVFKALSRASDEEQQAIIEMFPSELKDFASQIMLTSSDKEFAKAHYLYKTKYWSKEQFVEKLCVIFERCDLNKKRFFLAKVGTEIATHEALINYLGQTELHLLKLKNLYELGKFDKKSYIAAIIEACVDTEDGGELIKHLPLEIKFDRHLLTFLTPEDQIGAFLQAFAKKMITRSDCLHGIINVFNTFSDRVNRMSQLLPTWCWQETDLLILCPPREQVEFLWNNEQLEEYWPQISRAVRCMLLYKSIKEHTELINLKNCLGSDIVVDALIKIKLSKEKYTQQKLAMQFHAVFQYSILAKSWDLSASINCDALLPACGESVRFCEGKYWANAPTYDKVFCPRIKTCDTSRIVGDCSLPYEQWTLLEFFSALNVTLPIAYVKDSNEYVGKMSGWVNRLEEIRERLKCHQCGETLISDKKYSITLASYNATIFDCPNGYPHDQRIYLSHCWACRSIIDSRESKIRDGDYYICIHCGSGSRRSSFQQGEICPNCGMSKMGPGGSIRRKVCSKCGHEIEIPPDFKLTGASYDK